jgi:hypothetical protein
MQTSSIRSLKHKITEDDHPVRPKHVVFDYITYNKHQQAACKNFPKKRSFPLQAKQTRRGGRGRASHIHSPGPRMGWVLCSTPPDRFTLGECRILLKILGTMKQASYGGPTNIRRRSTISRRRDLYTPELLEK